MVFYFCRSDIQYGSHQAEIKVLVELCSFLEALGRDLILCLFQLPHSLSLSSLPHFQSQQHQAESSHCQLSSL